MSWSLSHHNRRFHRPTEFSDFIPLNDYCERTFLSRSQVNRLLLKGTIRGHKTGGRWWIEHNPSFGFKPE